MERYGHVLVKAFTERVDGPGLEAIVINYKALHDQAKATLNLADFVCFVFRQSPRRLCGNDYLCTQYTTESPAVVSYGDLVQCVAGVPGNDLKSFDDLYYERSRTARIKLLQGGPVVDWTFSCETIFAVSIIYLYCSVVYRKKSTSILFLHAFQRYTVPT